MNLLSRLKYALNHCTQRIEERLFRAGVGGHVSCQAVWGPVALWGPPQAPSTQLLPRAAAPSEAVPEEHPLHRAERAPSEPVLGGSDWRVRARRFLPVPADDYRPLHRAVVHAAVTAAVPV